MQLGKTISLCLLSTVLWNCEQSTQSESQSSKVPMAVEGLTKIAAVKAGYKVAAANPNPGGSDMSGIFQSIDPDVLRNAGICEGFVQVFHELQTLDENTTTIPPRLSEVIGCLEKNTDKLEMSTDPDQAFGVFDECFCGGTGTLYAGFRSFPFSKYSAPVTPGGKGYSAPVTTGAPYSAPQTTGSPYSAPSSAGGTTYSSPSL